MASPEDTDPSELRIRRVFYLTESLAAQRNADKGDIVLVCEGKKLYAHKMILEASSEYFAKLINSGFQESNTNRVEFKELDTETLNIILDFLYLGKVDKLQTDLQMKNVLKASHLMQIQDLLRYCSNNLILKLSTENFFEFLELHQKYELEIFSSELLDFWVLHSVELLSHLQFLLLPFEQIKGLGQFLKSINEKQDDLLLNFVKWVQHDSTVREQFASIMLEHVEFSLVTKQCFKTLYNDGCFEMMPKDFVAKIKEIGFAAFCSNNEIDCSQTGQRERSLMCKTPHLVFFSSECNVEVYDPSTNQNKVPRSEARYCFQQFDLLTMSWLPIYDIHADFCSHNSCQYQQLWYNINKVQVKAFNIGKCSFNGKDNLCIGVPNPHIHSETISDNNICYFRGHIYIIGGCITEYDSEHKWLINSPQCLVTYSKPDCKNWHKAVALPHAVGSIILLTSPYHLYVLDNETANEIRIQYNSAPDKEIPWEVVYVSTLGLLTTLNFFVFENTINALYIHDPKTVHLKYCHDEKRMKVNTFPTRPFGVKQVTRVCKCVGDQQTPLFISTVTNSFRIPDFLWDPKTGRWDILPAQSGRCKMPFADKCMEIL